MAKVLSNRLGGRVETMKLGVGSGLAFSSGRYTPVTSKTGH